MQRKRCAAVGQQRCKEHFWWVSLTSSDSFVGRKRTPRERRLGVINPRTAVFSIPVCWHLCPSHFQTSPGLLEPAFDVCKRCRVSSKFLLLPLEDVRLIGPSKGLARKACLDDLQDKLQSTPTSDLKLVDECTSELQITTLSCSHSSG